jgi:nucleotide-binding universal stress UspA family protein
MKKVLLAIGGVEPSHKVFEYAMRLCQRLKAELRVLQVVRSGQWGQRLRKVQRSGQRAKRFLEESMVAATFAEAGEHETAKDIMAQARKNMDRLMPESQRAGIAYHLTMTSESPSKEIINYVNEHRGVVLTIYDAGLGETPGSDVSAEDTEVAEEIVQHLSTPVVLMQS